MTAGSTASDDVRHVHLVDFEGGQPGVAGAASAATSPASMFAPSALVATGPERAPARRPSSVVVVDLPLVPVMTTLRRPAPSWRRIDLSRVIATRPPIMAPAPRPVTREAQRAAAPAASAARPRVVIFGLGIAAQFIRSPSTRPDTDAIYRVLSEARAILTV